MRLLLTPPAMATFLLALLLAVVAVVGHFCHVPFLQDLALYILLAAFVILAAGCLFTGI